MKRPKRLSRPLYKDAIPAIGWQYIDDLEDYCEELEARDEPMKMIVDESPLFNGYPNAHYECPKCRKSLWGDENYCGHCGQRLEK